MCPFTYQIKLEAVRLDLAADSHRVEPGHREVSKVTQAQMDATALTASCPQLTGYFNHKLPPTSVRKWTHNIRAEAARPCNLLHFVHRDR